MILIAGSPAPVDTDAWPPLAREIYEKKRRSPYVFDYTSLQHLQFEMLLRASIVQAARALNESGVEFATFEFARTNEMYWHLTPRGGFQLRAGVSPAAAIRDIYQNGYLYAFECATAIPIIYYKAVLDVLGDEPFNRLFQNLLLYSWNYDSDLGLIQERVGVERAFPGDVLYFDNPDHDPRMPEWQGVNVVMLDDDVFYGHGVGIATGWDIVHGLNRRRRLLSMTSAYLMDLIVYPDFLYLSRYMPGSAAGSTSASSPSPVPSSSSTQQPWLATSPYPAHIPPPLLTSHRLSVDGSRPADEAAPSATQDSSEASPAPWLTLPSSGLLRSAPRIRARVGRRRYLW